MGAVVFGLALLVPPTGDDWRRIAFVDRTPAGVAADVVEFYRQRNGRVVSNAVSILLMEPLWLRALAKAGTVVGLVAALTRVAGVRGPWGMLLCFAGVFLLPAAVFRQVFGWSTGFFFYLPPMIGVVLLVGTLAGRGPGDRARRRGPWVAVCAGLGLLTCLFIEHVTVAAVGLVVGALMVTVVRGRGVSPMLLGWAAGVLLGAAVMFASPGLRGSSGQGEDYYQAPWAGGDLLATVVDNYSLVTRFFVLGAPVVLAAVLATAMVVGLGASGRVPGRRAGPALVLGTVLVALWAVASRVLWSDRLRCEQDGTCDLRLLAVDLGVLVLLLGVLVLTFVLVRGTAADRAAWWGFLCAALLMIGPLLVVSPVGPRNLVGPLVAVTGMVALTGGRLLEGRAPQRSEGEPPAVPGGARTVVAGRAALVLVVVSGLALLTVVQAGNARVAAERASVMAQAQEQRQDHVVLPAFPHPRWVHDRDDQKIGNRWFLERRRDIAITFE